MFANKKHNVEKVKKNLQFIHSSLYYFDKKLVEARIKLRLHIRVMREAYCTTPYVRPNVMRDASKLFLLKKPPSANLLSFVFTHRGMAPYTCYMSIYIRLMSEI